MSGYHQIQIRHMDEYLEECLQGKRGVVWVAGDAIWAIQSPEYFYVTHELDSESFNQ